MADVENDRLPGEDQLSRDQLSELAEHDLGKIGVVSRERTPAVPLCQQVKLLRQAAEQHCSQISDLQQQLHTLDKSFVVFREKVNTQLFSK